MVRRRRGAPSAAAAAQLNTLKPVVGAALQHVCHTAASSRARLKERAESRLWVRRSGDATCTCSPLAVK